ncbi:MAG: isopentenyl-diphosphate delta-isomerase, partial [Bacteriovoracaceae bacterium]
MTEDIEKRKHDHIQLTFESQTKTGDERFNYEPLFSAHPVNDDSITNIKFLGKELGAPIWISSMTGGTELAKKINTNLAKVAKKYRLGMGLGSCRALLESQTRFDDFNMRYLLGYDLPLYANLGICQIEQLLDQNKAKAIDELVDQLEADGLIVHINPLQEWFQDEGDRLKIPALKVLEQLIEQTNVKIIVKEVGQGMGPKSLKALMKLPLEAIDFGAFGGTNFSYLEQLRSSKGLNDNMCLVGHTADEMVKIVLDLKKDLGTNARCTSFIISGGIEDYLQGFYLTQRLGMPSIYGQAK